MTTKYRYLNTPWKIEYISDNHEFRLCDYYGTPVLVGDTYNISESISIAETILRKVNNGEKINFPNSLKEKYRDPWYVIRIGDFDFLKELNKL